MFRQRQINVRTMRNQQGAVAIIVALCLTLLVGMLGLVLDLGHLYIAKTELQNAADAAALSGAKELNNTTAGIDSAVAWATATAPAVIPKNKNKYDLNSKTVTIGAGDVEFSSSPDGPWESVAEAQVNPANKTFIRVNTGFLSLSNWFIHVLPNISSTTQTFGTAVAGRYTTPITAIGVCSIRDVRETWVQYDTGDNDKYKVEFGYMQGINYDLQDINSKSNGLAGGTQLYIHPTATPDTGCNPSGGNADFSTPFLCTGRSAVSGTKGSTVYTNTGLAAGKSIAAINTRFDEYGSPLDASLDHTVCEPDANIRQYIPAVATNWMNSTSTPLDQTAVYGLASWLAGPIVNVANDSVANVTRGNLPTTLVGEKENKGGCGDDCSDNYGVVWTYTKPEKISGSFTTDDWAKLYPSGLSSTVSTYKEPSPYRYGLASENSTYFLAPSHTKSTAPEPRRILNLLIIDCPAAVNGICAPLQVLGVGKFFMQRNASVGGWVTGEFAGLVPESQLTSVVRLYR